MATRFDNSADGLVRANPDNISPTDLYTVGFHLYLASDQNFYNALWSVNTNDSANNFNLDVILLLEDGVSLGSYVGNHLDSGFSTAGTALSLNTWYYVVGVRDAMNSFKVYCNAVLDTTNPYDCTGRTTAFTREEIANLYTGDAFDFNGRMFNFMRWNRVLTAQEIGYQMRRFEPIYRGNTKLWTPMRDKGPAARKWDMVRGKYWTVDGTLTDEANPPKVESQFRKYFSLPLVAAVSGVSVPLFGVSGKDGYGIASHNVSATAVGIASSFAAGKPSEELVTLVPGKSASDDYGALAAALAYSATGVESGERSGLSSSQITTPLVGVVSQEAEGLPTGRLAVNALGVASEEEHGLVSEQLSGGLTGIHSQDRYGAVSSRISAELFGHDDVSLFGLIHTVSTIDVFGVGALPTAERYGAILASVSAALFGHDDVSLFGLIHTISVIDVFGVGALPTGERYGRALASLQAGLFGQGDRSQFGILRSETTVLLVHLPSQEKQGLIGTELIGGVQGFEDGSLFGLIRTEAAVDVTGVGALPSGEGYSLIVVELQPGGGLRIPRKVSHTLADWEPLNGIAPKERRWRKLGS